MTPHQRPLAGLVVNLSISESEDSGQQGFPPWQVNRVTLQMVSALLGQGAGIVFGHDWRDDGVMAATHAFALQMQAPLISAEEAEQPILRNFLPWPDSPYLPGRDLEQLHATLQVESCGLPAELSQTGEQARLNPDGATFRYLRARGLTFLRHRLTELSHARICLGGRTFGFTGRYPGIVEEALLALRSKRPLYLARVLGGATEQVIHALEGKELPNGFCPPAGIEELYLHPPVMELVTTTQADRKIDRRAIWQEFSEAGVTAIAQTNGLTVQENIDLFNTPVVEQVIEMVLIGLSRLKTRHSQ